MAKAVDRGREGWGGPCRRRRAGPPKVRSSWVAHAADEHEHARRSLHGQQRLRPVQGASREYPMSAAVKMHRVQAKTPDFGRVQAKTPVQFHVIRPEGAGRDLRQQLATFGGLRRGGLARLRALTRLSLKR